MNDSFSILPFKTRKINNNFLLATILGDWAILTKDEFRQVHSYSVPQGSSLFRKLRASGIIVGETDISRRLDSYRRLNNNLSRGVSLHIAVLTEKCNFSCKYCQTREEKGPSMDVKVAERVLYFLMKSNSKVKTLEFQGGEPLLCWDTIKWFVKNITKMNKSAKQRIRLSLVSNLSLLDEEKLDYLIENNLDICTSLDGPDYVHDRQRIYADRRPTYKDTVKKIEMINQAYKSKNIKKRVNLLPTITKFSLPYAKEIIDEYLKWGMPCVPLRFVNPLKRASREWESLGYSAEDFNRFWKDSLDYMIDLNKKGIFVFERIARVLLNKILKKKDPHYVDLVSPCGGGRNVLTYMPNGDVYTCDEARMIGSDLFKLGNVIKDSYEKVMKSPKLLGICQASFLGFWDYTSPYSLWSGTCPVMNFARQHNPVVKISQTPHYQIHNFQLDYLTNKVFSDRLMKSIFNRWCEYKE
jgi:His-Xaa-Ser system radical SAM maturase HxsB